MLVNLKNMMIKAKKEKYAIPQLNINNLEWVKYILEESQSLNSPIILGVSEGATKYMGGYKTVVNIIKGLIEDLSISIEVTIHLDHSSSFESCQKAIDAGFTSVMIDASEYNLDENIKITKQVVEYAHQRNVTVEAEIGAVGGEEDGKISENQYAKTEEAIKLATETSIDILAPALGSVHGFYKGEPNLNFDRMEEISVRANIPLVLHGGTGIYDDQIIKAINLGTTKINVNTELQVAWAKAVKEYIINNNEIYDPRKIISSGEEALKKVVRNKILLFKNR